jgi:hypothetical protein
MSAFTRRTLPVRGGAPVIKSIYTNCVGPENAILLRCREVAQELSQRLPPALVRSCKETDRPIRSGNQATRSENVKNYVKVRAQILQ